MRWDKRQKLVIGSKYGSWTVLKDEGLNKNKSYHYKCECVCGTQRFITFSSLKNGLRTRCQKCFFDKKTRATTSKYIGKKYHSWEVVGVKHVDYSGITKLRITVQHSCGYAKDINQSYFYMLALKEFRCWGCRPRNEKHVRIRKKDK